MLRREELVARGPTFGERTKRHFDHGEIFEVVNRIDLLGDNEWDHREQRSRDVPRRRAPRRPVIRSTRID